MFPLQCFAGFVFRIDADFTAISGAVGFRFVDHCFTLKQTVRISLKLVLLTKGSASLAD
jgi:hypothetical protein